MLQTIRRTSGIKSLVSSCTQHLLDQVARHAIDEESHHYDQQYGQNNFDDKPFVAGAHQVAHSFQRTQEPEEGGVGPAVSGRVR